VTRTMTAALGALAAATAIAPAAHAQTPLDGGAYAFPVPDYVGALVGANSLDAHTGRGHGRGSDKPKQRKQRVRRPSPRQLAALRFVPAPEVTQGVYQRVIDEVGPSIDPAVLTGQLDAAKTEFREFLERIRWSSSNLADVAAFSLVQGYVTWHQVTRLSEPGLKALRRDVRANLALQKRVRRLSDARQQEIAEILELRVIFFLDARNDAVALGDSAGVAVARADIREWTETIFDVDVNEIRLTRRGLVAR
jgi:hypothetical protein